MHKRILSFALLWLCLSLPVFAKTGSLISGDFSSDLKQLVEQPVVPGHEAAVSTWIAAQLKSLSPKVDALGDVMVTLGSGQPHRLIAASLDEPGFVVSRINDDGFIRVQRLPQTGALPLFQELSTGQPLLVSNRNGKWSNAVMAGLSVHLQPQRKQRPDMNDLDNLWVDVGATSAAEVNAAGIEVLAPLALDRQLHRYGSDYLTATSVGDRYGAALLLEGLRAGWLKPTLGSVTVAFVTQNWVGARGLVSVLNQTKPDELVFLGRFLPATTTAAPAANSGDAGVLIGTEKADAAVSELGQSLQSLASQNNVKLSSQAASPLLPRSYLPLPKLPAKTAHLSLPIWWPVTPAETIHFSDVQQLAALLRAYIGGTTSGRVVTMASPEPQREVIANQNGRASRPSQTEILKTLVESYGASDHEKMVTDTVKSLLPQWAKPTPGPAGDLVLDWGNAAKAPDLVVVAHVDEIGYEVKSIGADGRLELEDKGGGLFSFFLGHPLLFHLSDGTQRAGVLELPADWQKPDFKWQTDSLARNAKLTAFVGASSADEVAKLGIKVGDFATVAKKYRPLLGQRASARSFDDRMGCAALVDAVWALGPDLKGRRVTFVWSTGEELGLLGAGAYAKQLASEGKSPRYVFAVDTFVSADSPIESKRFGDGILGKGFVIRAVDNSNIVPLKDVDRLRQLMAQQKIPTQYGVTGGGNDGASFVPFGTIDVAMGWPLRYSHSPGEVIDLRDLDALARAVAAVARLW